MAEAASPPRREFLGWRFDPIALADALAWIGRRSSGDAFAYVVTPNVDHLVRLEGADPGLRAAYEVADLLLCDSRIVARLAALWGIGLPVVTGSDLTAALLRGMPDGGSLYLVGGRDGDAEQLRRLRPGLRIAQHRPPMGLRHDPAARARAIAATADARADVILLAVGSPQQELLAKEMAASGTVGGTALCIGASVDFLTGAQRRAPRLVQRAGMEWAWRLGGSPLRLSRRYLIEGPAIVPMLWRWHKRWRAG